MTQRFNPRMPPNPYMQAQPIAQRTHVMPVMPPPFVRAKLVDGGITDKSEQELIQLGGDVNIVAPPTALGGTSSFWINGSGENPGPGGRASTNEGTILQATSRAPDHPELLAININPPLFDLTNFNAVDFDLKVRATWGIGADKCSAVIDVLNGAQFSLAATELTLQGLYTLVDLQGSPAGPTIQIGGSIGLKTRPGSDLGPCFTATIIGVLATASVDVTIPAYAKSFMVYMSSPAAVSSPVTIGFVRGVAAAPFFTVVQAPNDIGRYPIPNGISRIRLTAPAANGIQGSVRFDLAL